jgi:hypothetical protein
MTFKELKEKLEKLHVPDEAEVQVLTDTGVADAVEVSLHIEPENNSKQVMTLYTQAGIQELFKSIKNDVKNNQLLEDY